MELYRKKINIENKPKRGRDRNMRSENYPRKNVYFQKMIKDNLSQPKNETLDLSTAGENMNNIRSSMEEIFSTEENKKKAIRYVIDLGKMKYIRNSPKIAERNKKSASPQYQGGGTIISGNIESSRITPVRSYYDGKECNTYIRHNQIYDPNNNNKNRLTPHTTSNFYPSGRNYSKLINNPNRMQSPKQMQFSSERVENQDYYENPQNYNPKYINNPEESQNEYDLSSIEDRNIQVIRNTRSPEPRMVVRAQQVLRERYQNAQRQQNYPQRQINQNKMLPRQRS